MKLPESMLSILRCPETRQRLTVATPQQISAINQHIDTDYVTNALLREDGIVAYPIDDGYPVLLLDRQLRRSDGAAW